MSIKETVSSNSKKITNYLDRNINYIILAVIIFLIYLVMKSMNGNGNGNSNSNVNNNHNHNRHELVEGFRNNLKDLMDKGYKRRKEKFEAKQSKKSEMSKLFNRLSKTENFYDKNDRSMEHFKSKIKNYYKSFDRERFTNVPKNSRLSLEKFKFFKQAFWDIFKD
jgi:hypothetical protein